MKEWKGRMAYHYPLPAACPSCTCNKGDNSIEPKCFTALQASLGAHQSTSEVVEVVLMNQQINQMTDLQSQQMSKGHQRPLSKSLEIQECSKTLRWEWCRVSAVVEHALWAVVGSCAIWPSAGRWTKVPMCQTNPDRRYLADISRDSWTKSTLMIRFGWKLHRVRGKRHIREEAERFTNLIKFVHISIWIFIIITIFYIFLVYPTPVAGLSINAIGLFWGEV